ncbi:MAG: MarR family transcriptional regulator [Rhizobiaceae bacterium]|nr:MarR family transcriptional regulator [Rhizobiaceae bacterium]
MYLLNQVNQSLRSALNIRMREFKITGLQYTILTVVRSYKGISSAELSRRFFVTPQTMNETVTGMERRGLLERREQQSNKRILVAFLTLEGEELLKKCDSIADEIDTEAFGDMSDEDFKTLRELLRDRLKKQRNETR